MRENQAFLDVFNNEYFSKNLLSYILSIDDLENLALTCRTAYRRVKEINNIHIQKKRKYCTTLVINDKEIQKQVAGTGRIRTLFLNEVSLNIEREFYKTLSTEEIEVIDEVNFRIEDKRRNTSSIHYDEYAPKIAKIICEYFEIFYNAKILNFMDSCNNHLSGFPLAVIRFLDSPRIEVIHNVNAISIDRYFKRIDTVKNGFFNKLSNLKEFGICREGRKCVEESTEKVETLEPFFHYLRTTPHIIVNLYMLLNAIRASECADLVNMIIQNNLKVRIDFRLSWLLIEALKFPNIPDAKIYDYVYHMRNSGHFNRIAPKLCNIKSLSIYVSSESFDTLVRRPMTRQFPNFRDEETEKWPLNNLKYLTELEELIISSSIRKDTFSYEHFLPFEMQEIIVHVLAHVNPTIKKLTIVTYETLSQNVIKAITDNLPNLESLTLQCAKIKQPNLLNNLTSINTLYLSDVKLNFEIPPNVKYLIIDNDVKPCECNKQNIKYVKHWSFNKKLFKQFPEYLEIQQDLNIPLRIYYKNCFEKYRYMDIVRRHREKVDSFTF
uniref:F-box domain-containing protein n=1 Tax=Parastrongyloides trichosuri TaxID=131310 RepID=A0A0N4ZQF1_PARTI